MDNHNFMDGPIPGESLTKTPGASPYENPPQFVHLDDALEYFWSKFNSPSSATQLYGMLKAKIPAEAIARTVLFTAFSKGIITVDLALQSLPTVVKQIVAIGHFLGVKNIQIKVPDKKKTQALAAIAKLMDASKEEPAQPTNKSTIFTGLGM